MKNTENRHDTAWYRTRIELLAEFMTPERYATLCRTIDCRTNYVTVLAENMFHGQNAAALMRHCEAFGVQRLHTVETVCPFEPNPNTPEFRTRRSPKPMNFCVSRCAEWSKA